MYKILLLTIICMPLSLLAAGLPESTNVTPENSEKLGIVVSVEASGASAVKLFSLEFPQEYQGCKTGRVSSTLLGAQGNEITSTSMDYQVGSSSPSILGHFQPSNSDMAFVIQYCCSGTKAPDCKSALVINSIKELGTWK